MSKSYKEMLNCINDFTFKINKKLVSKEYAKGFLYGRLGTLHEVGFITDDEYDELSVKIDDLMN